MPDKETHSGQGKMEIPLGEYPYFTSIAILSCLGDDIHNGVQEKLCQVTSSFWIVKSRQVVKRVFSTAVESAGSSKRSV